MAYVVLALRVAIGALLFVAGALKAHDGAAATAVTIAGYRILPAGLIAPLGVALPYFEMLLGLYLAAGLFTRIAGWLAAGQFAIFSVAVASLVIRQIPADCGCFGSALPTPPSWGHVGFDVLLMLLAALIALRAPGRFAVDRLLFPSSYFDTGREKVPS
jgi:putative oxidoreductase